MLSLEIKKEKIFCEFIALRGCRIPRDDKGSLASPSAKNPPLMKKASE